eukprot:g9864.t1
MHVWKNDTGLSTTYYLPFALSTRIEDVSDDGVDKDQEDDVFAQSTYETTSPPQFLNLQDKLLVLPPLAVASSAPTEPPSARAESKANKAPKDINGNIDSSNVINDKRHRNPRPPHHASHSVKLAVDDDCYTAAASNEPECDVYELFLLCLFILPDDDYILAMAKFDLGQKY